MRATKQTLIAGLAVSFTLATASGQENKPKASAPATVAESGGLNMVGGGGRSAHFDAVASHLQVGGSVFGYMDVDGDVEKIAGMLQKLKDSAPEGELPPQLAQLDLAKLLGDIGLDGIEAMGMSSYKNGDLFHNRAYVHVPAGRKGFLKMLGGAPAPFLSTQLAPADADLVMEQTLNLKAGYEVMSKLVMEVGGEDAYADFRSEMSEVSPQIGLSMAEVFGRLDTRLTVVARVHPDKPLEIPDAPFEIPSFDFLLALDDVSWLYEKVTANMKAEMPADQVAQMFVKGDGFEKIALPPMPSPDMAVMQPVIYHDIANKRIVVASSAGFLAECMSGKTKLAAGADFKSAIEGLPTEGNGLSYVSADFMKTARGMIDKATKSGGLGTQEMVIISTLMPIFVGAEHGQAKVTVNEPEGIFVSSNSTMSVKEAVFLNAASMMMPAMVGFQRSNKAQAMPMPMEAAPELRIEEE